MQTLILHPWHWILLSLLLIALETLGIGGFLLGAIFSGFIMATLLWFYPSLHWSTELIIFAILTLIFTLLYWKYFRKFNQKSDNVYLNNRIAQLQGTTFIASDNLPAGTGKLQIGDTLWKIKSNTKIKKGDILLVTNYQEMTLIVEKTDT